MKNSIEHYISYLLFRHECVVVPNFGAFLTRSFSAEINTATHMMRPPSKRLVFNRRIRENDGLLAKAIAMYEGISYSKALEFIESEALSWKKILRSGKKVQLKGVGRLYLDSGARLQFNPSHDINYDQNSYGLYIFRATAMQREQEIKKSVSKAIESHKKEKPKSENKSGESKRSWLPWVAALGPVAALLLAGSYLYNKDPQSLTNISGYVVNIFSSEERRGTENAESSLEIEEGDAKLNGEFGPEDDVLSELKEEAVDKGSNDSHLSSENDAIASEGLSSSKEYASSSKTAPPISKGNYQVIVGSFSQAQNAEVYSQELLSMGYQAYTVPNGNFTRVAIGNFSQSSEAMGLLRGVRSELTPHAWLNAY